MQQDVPQYMAVLLLQHLTLIIKMGQGPAWANSLFEDNAEYGLGLSLGASKLRDRIALRMTGALTNGSVSAETKAVFEEWLEGKR